MLTFLEAAPLLANMQTTDNSGSTISGAIGGVIGYILFVAAVWPLLKKPGNPHGRH